MNRPPTHHPGSTAGVPSVINFPHEPSQGYPDTEPSVAR